MALIENEFKSFPYIICDGSPVGGGSGTTAIENIAIIASSVSASDRIVATSSTRLTFQEAGWYEFDFPFSMGLSTSDGSSKSISLYYGINGSWSLLTSSLYADDFPLGNLFLNFILKLNVNDYFEMKTVVSGSVAQHFTWAGYTGFFAYSDSNICIKRIA